MTTYTQLMETMEAQRCQIVVNLEDLTNIVAYVMEKERERIKEEEAQKEEKATMTPDDVAKRMNVARTTLWVWEKHGLLIPTRIGGKVFYKRSQVDELMKQGKTGGKKRGRKPKNFHAQSVEDVTMGIDA